MDNIKTLKARLLVSLARKRKWGKSHTAYENMFKSLKSEAFGKDALKLVKKLADEGRVLPCYGDVWSSISTAKLSNKAYPLQRNGISAIIKQVLEE